MEIQSPKLGMTKQKVCTSCARAMRGRYKVQRLPPHIAFHCAMGDGESGFFFVVVVVMFDSNTYIVDIAYFCYKL